MTILTESVRAGEFIIAEGNGSISREAIVIAAAAGALAAGTLLGKITKGAATPAAVAGNTGNGTIASATVGANSLAGVYRAVCIEPATDAGKFEVENPAGVIIGVATVGVAFSAGGIGFTIADGSTDFASGDSFTITVAAGSGKYVAYDNTATDGSEVAAGILYAPVEDLATDQPAVAIARHAEVDETLLVGLDTPARADLAALQIILR